ncbi:MULTISPECIES: extracellular matrix/biofilm biosynthesis regulator RemA family protein [Peptoniphilus]|uniref:extracellular matrix/biofilm biosynthesis regulator RemA family protein n=1 Tax=Peptoniphilus TaxID=162289 RepID=UPI0001DA9C01|nr:MULTISPECIES: extracellular matrix/biofilm biosynthesis regulator RemA family protein [Peptoniphilus]EFI42190.1 hypothetical protein HMPREF0629_00831 [Peptoniphilus sp. oral taxon 386 str. F0131]
MINIGFGNIINESRIIAVIDPDSAPIKRLISESRDKGLLVDSTYGRKTRSVIIMDTSQIILASIQPETIAARISEGKVKED